MILDNAYLNVLAWRKKRKKKRGEEKGEEKKKKRIILFDPQIIPFEERLIVYRLFQYRIRATLNSRWKEETFFFPIPKRGMVLIVVIIIIIRRRKDKKTKGRDKSEGASGEIVSFG